MTNSSALPRSTPESQGVDSRAIESLVRSFDEKGLGLHSLMVVRHGHVVAEGWWQPYVAELPHTMFSVSKSVVATAIGIAEAEGRLSVDEPLINFFPSYATPEVRENVKDLRLRHVLSMATGHAVDTMAIMRTLPDEDWVKIFLAVPIVFPPGTHFLYNSGASFILSAIVASRTGQNVREYLIPRLFEPLGVETPAWQANKRGLSLGASGIRWTTEDLAKLGQLYLQRGVWNGKRVLTEEWIDKATTAHVANGSDPDDDWCQGYCFQFWRSRHNSYRADGAYGQFSLVLPDQDLVVAITSGSGSHKVIPGVVFDQLLPGVHDAALPENPAARKSLVERTETLALPTPAFLPTAPAIAATVSGRRITVPFNTVGVTSLSLGFGESATTVSLRDAEGRDETTEVGRTEWLPGRTALWPHAEMDSALTASVAGWLDEHTFEMHQQCVETAFRRTWTFSFGTDDTVTVTVALDHPFWAERTETLRGTLA